MANIIEITDITRPELDVYARLTEPQLRSPRAAGGLFIAESAKVIGYALDAGCEPVSLLMERGQLSGQGGRIARRCGEAPVYVAGKELLSSLTGYALTRGILCAMRRPPLPEPEAVCTGAERIAVLEGITDTTNVGAVFRSAAALGADAVLLRPSCADPLTRRACRVSMGTVFQIPWTRLGRTATDWPEKGLARLRDMGFRTAALALSPEAVAVDDPRLAAEPKLALLLGTEGDGLSPETVALCDYTVRIPMARGVDSLNVAAAGAVAFWQLCRKRS